MRRLILPFAALALLCTVSTAQAAMVSTMANPGAVMDAYGFSIVPVQELRISGDEGVARVYEIVRPNGQPFSIGRLNTSCTCVQLEAQQTSFAQGERAFVTLRNVRATPPQGQMYAFYVQITSPMRATLRGDVFVQSDRFRQEQVPMPAGYYSPAPQGPRVFYR